MKALLCFSVLCSVPSDRGLKSSSSMQQSMCLCSVWISAGLLVILFSHSPFSSVSCQSSCHLFSSIFKQWNNFSLFFWKGVSASALVCQADTLATVFMIIIVPRLSDTIDSRHWWAQLGLLHYFILHIYIIQSNADDRSYMLYWSCFIWLTLGDCFLLCYLGKKRKTYTRVEGMSIPHISMQNK